MSFDGEALGTHDNAAGQLVFLAVHVPKCAGSTLERHMAKHLPTEERWITRKRSPRLPLAWGRPYTLHRAPEIRRVRFISGHYVGRSLERMLPERPIRRSVLLREPTSFMISYYNYRMMRYLSLGWKPYSFETHLRSLPSDPITHFLLERWLEIPWPALMIMSPARKYQLLNHELRRFWYVADYGHCDELTAMMGAELGISTVPERLNTQEEWTSKVNWRPLTTDDLTPELRSEIAARTRLDRALWQSWAGARLNTASIEPVPLEGTSRFNFPLAEVKRPVHQVARRLQRGWS